MKISRAAGAGVRLELLNRQCWRVNLETIKGQLNDRQRRLLGDVARLHVVTGAQLQRLHYEPSLSGQRLARRDLGRLADLRVLARLSRQVGGVRAGSSGYVYALDVAGQRLVNPDRNRYRRPWTPRPEQLAHSLAVSDIYVRLRETDRRGPLTLTTFDAEPACWRRFAGPGGSPLTLKPDAYVVTEDQDNEYHGFIEVDRGTEPLTRITRKCRTYLSYWDNGREETISGVFPRVIWTAEDSRRREQLRSVVASLPAEMQAIFAVASSDNLVRVLAPSSGDQVDRDDATSTIRNGGET